jgi:hypothetical protein
MKRFLASASIALLLPLAAHAQLVVTGSTDGTALANDILGPGFTLVPGSVSYVGGSSPDGGTFQGGFFSGGTSAGITINSGILLTSGSVENAVGPNDQTGATYAWGSAGDADLSALAGGATTNDANSLTFSFDAATDGTVFFNYVFGSEEYNEYVGSYNDVFGFFLDGSNVALLPGTTTPVSINDVNLFTNSADYINNGNADDPYPAATLANIQYDGFTVPLTVSANVTAGEHTIKLAIADEGDDLYDSGVFIEGGSFSTAPTPTGGVPDAASTLALFGTALAGVSLLRRKLA